jgi:calcium/calmodulin-dependent protein kinase (CaM kinase) II
MLQPIQEEILQLNQRLLEAIAAADWSVYEELCDPGLTAFEPEARGHRVEGLAFHRFYFSTGPAERSDASSDASNAASCTTMVDPRVTMLGEDAALLTCVRLVQAQTPQGPITQRAEETRIWQRRDGSWRHIHFHRSDNG